MGWSEAAVLIEKGIEKAIARKKVTYDLARLMEGAEEISCSRFAEQVCEHMDSLA
jgi:isocitrate dehydrogenase